VSKNIKSEKFAMQASAPRAQESRIRCRCLCFDEFSEGRVARRRVLVRGI
jgi:hypothetical protein